MFQMGDLVIEGVDLGVELIAGIFQFIGGGEHRSGIVVGQALSVGDDGVDALLVGRGDGLTKLAPLLLEIVELIDECSSLIIGRRLAKGALQAVLVIGEVIENRLTQHLLLVTDVAKLVLKALELLGSLKMVAKGLVEVRARTLPILVGLFQIIDAGHKFLMFFFQFVEGVVEDLALMIEGVPLALLIVDILSHGGHSEEQKADEERGPGKDDELGMGQSHGAPV